MAAGSSAPELATVVIGVFFAKDDIGKSSHRFPNGFLTVLERYEPVLPVLSTDLTLAVRFENRFCR